MNVVFFCHTSPSLRVYVPLCSVHPIIQPLNNSVLSAQEAISNRTELVIVQKFCIAGAPRKITHSKEWAAIARTAVDIF